MNIKEILLKPVSELTMDEQEQAAKFLKVRTKTYLKW